MGYLHINNLYKDQDILLFKECYALEKIHGTFAHIAWKNNKLLFHSGGAKHESFIELFLNSDLENKFKALGHDIVFVYGEAYGGKVQKMKDIYGPELKFVVFDVKIDGNWLSVPQAENVTQKLDLEFVHYVQTSTKLELLDAQRDADSVQAIRNGLGFGKLREGVVLRPLIEVTKNNGHRIIAKHKRPEFMETATPRNVDSEKLKVLTAANEIAFEWVTAERLRHVLDKFPHCVSIENTSDVIKAMIEDVVREAENEIVDSKEVRKAIGKKAATLFKLHLQENLN